MMDEYYRYEYEDNGQYCYPHTHILKNKLDIHDKEQLFKAEQELSSARYFEISQRPIPGDFSLQHLQAIHRYLFQDIYNWAGEIRTVDISKGTIFCLTQFIEIEFKKVQEWIIHNDYLMNVDNKEDMAKKLNTSLEVISNLAQQALLQAQKRISGAINSSVGLL
jgi:cell filamentation protein